MSLTSKQEAFCQAIADGLGQSEAYKATYDASRMKDSSIYVRACELMSNSKIQVRLKELREALQEKQLWSREQSINALISVYREGSPAVKVAAVKELNLMHGYNAPMQHNIQTRIIIQDESE